MEHESEYPNYEYVYIGNGEYIKFSTFKNPEIEINYYNNPEEPEMLDDDNSELVITQKKKKIDDKTLDKLKTAGKIIAATVASGTMIYFGAKMTKIQNENMERGMKEYKKFAQTMTKYGGEISQDSYVRYNKLTNEAEVKGK